MATQGLLLYKWQTLFIFITGQVNLENFAKSIFLLKNLFAIPRTVVLRSCKTPGIRFSQSHITRPTKNQDGFVATGRFLLSFSNFPPMPFLPPLLS
jgi:hypothetical protein